MPVFEYPDGFHANYHADKPICGVLAVAIAAGVTYDVAHATCKQAMHDVYPSRQRFGGKTYEAQIDLALKRLGVQFDKTIYNTKGPKLINLVKELEPGVMYHIITPKHISTLKDGYIIDQSKLTLVELAGKIANQKVKYIRKIIGKGW